MANKVYVSELAEGDFVQTTFLLTDKAMRTSRNGDAYLRVVLEDRSGSIEGRGWTDPEALASRVEIDDFVAVRGEVSVFGDLLHIQISDIERLPDSSVDTADFFPTSRWGAEALFGQLRDLLDEELSSEPIRAFVDALFDDEDIAERFRTAPAAMTNHHAYLGGLLEHCLSMCRVATRLAGHYELYYPGLINRDLLLAGVVLHDFAKIWELSYRRSFDYTTPGRLVGHIPMGAELVGRIAGRAKRPISEDLQMHLRHLVLAHHGELEYGSPIKPATAEALLLHQIDMIDSRMNMLWKQWEAECDPSAPESWTGYRRTLGGRILFRGKNSSDWELSPKVTSESLAGPGIERVSTPASVEPSARTLNLFDEET